ncbi:MAG: hypothetical protein IJK92_00245 [Bacteroidales bacterium]|nr:hypothetical protein [Bacteroidales bacterium]
MKRRIMKVYALVMAMLLLLPIFAFAQKSDGFFKVNDDYYNRGLASGGTFGLGGNITPASGGMGLGGMNNETPGGMSLGGMVQEDPSPLGSGLLILTAIGAGYAIFKRKQH